MDTIEAEVVAGGEDNPQSYSPLESEEEDVFQDCQVMPDEDDDPMDGTALKEEVEVEPEGPELSSTTQQLNTPNPPETAQVTSWAEECEQALECEGEGPPTPDNPASPAYQSAEETFEGEPNNDATIDKDQGNDNTNNQASQSAEIPGPSGNAAAADKDPENKKTFCKDIPMSAEITWDFSMKALNPNSNILYHTWIEGNIYQQLEEACLHEMQNVVCGCDMKVKLPSCRLCSKSFCSPKCFRTQRKEQTGERDDKEVRHVSPMQAKRFKNHEQRSPKYSASPNFLAKKDFLGESQKRSGMELKQQFAPGGVNHDKPPERYTALCGGKMAGRGRGFNKEFANKGKRDCPTPMGEQAYQDYVQRRNHHNQNQPENGNQKWGFQQIKNQENGHPEKIEDKQDNHLVKNDKTAPLQFSNQDKPEGHTTRRQDLVQRVSPQHHQIAPDNSGSLRVTTNPGPQDKPEARSEQSNQKSPNFGTSDGAKNIFRNFRKFTPRHITEEQEISKFQVEKVFRPGCRPFSFDFLPKSLRQRWHNDNTQNPEQKDQGFQWNTNGALHAPAPDIPFGVTLQVRRVAGASLADFGVIPISKLEQFKTLQRDLQQARLSKMEVIRFGNFCAAKYWLHVASVEQWYRGIITSVDGATVGIYFLDLGIIVGIKRERVMGLPEGFRNLKPLAIRMTCLNLNADHQNQEIQTNFLERLGIHEDIKVKVTHMDAQEPFMYAGKVYVEHLHKWFDIAVLWANLGMGEVVPLEQIEASEKRNVITKMGDEFSPPVLEQAGLVKATIADVTSVLDFYITEDQTNERGKIERQLSRKNAQVKAKRVADLKDLSYPLFMFSDGESGKTVRVKVLETDGETALIQNCDYGNNEPRIVPISELYQLPEEFHSKLPLVYKCGLPVKQPLFKNLSALQEPNQALKGLEKVPVRVKVLKIDKGSSIHTVELFLEGAIEGCTLGFLDKGQVELLKEFERNQLFEHS